MVMKPFSLPSEIGELANMADRMGTSPMLVLNFSMASGFVAKVEIDLNRSGLLHHAMAQRADLFHIRNP